MLYLGVFAVSLLASLPIAVAILAVGMAFLYFSADLDLFVGAQRVATGIDSFPLLAIPFFLLAAELMNVAGITDRIFRFAKCLVGRVPGGLGHVNVLASMMFASMSGSGVADAAGLGRIEVRAMLKDGYDRDFSAAITAASSTIAPIIPPSISLVIFGVTSGVSIGGLFLGGVLPGILMGLSLMLIVAYFSAKRGYGRSDPVTAREFTSSAKGAFLPLLTPVIVVGGIWGGVFTPTEAGAVAVLYALFLGTCIYRNVRLVQLPEIIFQTALSAANVLFIIAVAALAAWLLTLVQLPSMLALMIVDLAPQPWMFLLALNVLLLALGCCMPSASVIIMLTPILMPVATVMEIHPVHLGVMMVLNLMIGLITPPVGLALFAVSEVAELSVSKLFTAILPFMVPLVAALLLITFLPEIVLILPRWFGYI